MNQDAVMIAALVFLVGVAVFGRKAQAVPGVPDGYQYDSALGAYTKVLPDGTMRWLT